MNHDSSNTHAGVVAAVLTAVQDFAHGPLVGMLISILVGIGVGQLNRILNARFGKKQ